jgi:hypothetical protein
MLKIKKDIETSKVIIKKKDKFLKKIIFQLEEKTEDRIYVARKETIELQRYKIKRLANYYRSNTKQAHYNKKDSGRKYALTPSGTGRGISRQPRTRGVVRGVPNAVGGPRAHPPKNKKLTIKLNKKEIISLKLSTVNYLLYHEMITCLNLPKISAIIKFKEKDKRTLLPITTNTETQKIQLFSQDQKLTKSYGNGSLVTAYNTLRFDKILEAGIPIKSIIVDYNLIKKYLPPEKK